jgi:hypothetical protein
MQIVEVSTPRGRAPAALPALVERAVAEVGLASRRLELCGYPGATHWHIRRPGAKGTLELTYCPSQGRLWFAIHANRRADWITSALDELTARMMQADI